MEISEDLKEIVSSTIASIEEGIKDRDAGVAIVKFELAVVKAKEGKGGFKFHIAELGGNYSTERVSRITFDIASTKLDARNPQSLFWLRGKP